MAENTQHYAGRRLFPRASGDLLVWTWAHKAELAVGTLAASAAALFVSAHWIIAVVGGVVVLALSIAESEGILLLAVFFVPLGWALQWNVPVRDVPVAFRTLVIVGFFLGRLLRGWQRVAGLLRPALSRASLLFLCTAAASTMWGAGEFTHESARSLWTLSTFVGFYFVVLAWADSPQRVRKILQVLLCSTIVTAAFAILQEIVGDYTSLWYFLLNPPQDVFVPMDYRAPSFFGNCNSLAGYLNLIISFSLACSVLGKARWKMLGAWTTGLGVLGLLCTQSLGGLVSFGSVVVLAVFCFVGDLKKRLLLLGCICTFAIGFYFAREILNPTHQGEGFGTAAMSRLVLWGVAWDLFVHSPIFGVGWGNFSTLYGSFVNSPGLAPGILDVNNLYLQLLAETGIVGFTAFFSLIFLAGRKARLQWCAARNDFGRVLSFGVLGAILSVLVHGCVDFLFRVDPQFGTLFWVLLALLVVSGTASGETVAGGQAVERTRA